ncbi:MAG: ComF family protein [bacterium]|nr:ComF family protein [bacterium]
MSKKIDSLLFPSFCINCKTGTPEEPPSLRWLCLNCHKLLITRWQKVSFKPEITESYYIFDYQKDKLAKKLIHSLKYDFVKEIADTFYVSLESERFNLRRLTFDFIAPVPLHKRRLKERGFNQSELIAKKIAEITEIPILDNIVKRKIYRRPQMEVKNREARIKNTQNIFECLDVEKIKGKTILLVDDVATTGATLKECARTLKSAGAHSVLSFTLAQD